MRKLRTVKNSIAALLSRNNGGMSLRQSLLSGAPFSAPLTYSAIPTRAAPGTTATFTRATATRVKNNDGYEVPLLSGEIGFVGARRVYNIVSASEDLSTFTQTNCTYTKNLIGPDGVANSAGTLTATAGNALFYKTIPTGGVGKLVLSVQLKRLVGTGAVYLSVDGANTQQDITSQLTSGWTRIEVSHTLAVSNFPVITLATSGDSIGIGQWQYENVTAQTTQTAGEYVSVGALDYRSELNRLYLSLPGTAGHYASTPDSVANSITGDIEFIAKIFHSTLRPAVNSVIVGKTILNVTGTGSYSLTLTTTGALRLDVDLGIGVPALTSSSVISTSYAGTCFYVKANRTASTGKANFYTSLDGATWSALGVEQTSTAGGIIDTALSVTVGCDAANTWPFAGKIFSAQIYNTIGGTTPVVDFNPHRDATTPTGIITSSTTGEVWTINGASSVVRSDYYHGSMVDGVKCFATDINGAAILSSTLLGYQAQGARTNLCLQSNAFTTTWTETGTVAATQNLVGPDGGTTGWTLTDNDAGTPEGILQTYGALTAANYAQSIFIKKTSGATSFPVIRLNEPVTPKEALCTVDTNNGVATVWTAYTGSTMVASSASCASHNADWWRVTLVFAATTASWRIVFYPSATTNATQSTGTVSATVTGTCGIYGSQLELGSFASSYIPTTTVAVTRNADVLTYSSAGNVSGTVGAAYAEIQNSWSTAAGTSEWALSFNTSGAGMIDSGDNSSLAFRAYDGTNTVTATAGNSNTSVVKQAMAWGGTTLLAARSGTVASGTFDGDMSPTAIYPGGYNQIQGTIRNVRIWQRALSSSELQAVTA